MRDMKKSLFNVLAVLLPVLAVSACNEQLQYVTGEEEAEGVYGVYFPAQENSTVIEIEPNFRTEASYIVRRTNTEGDITVPVTVTESEDRIFVVEPIEFADGEGETTLKLYFPNAKIGTEYTCNISIDDPQYRAVYGKRRTELTISVLRAGWNLVGQGKWRDDIIASLYGSVPVPNPEVEVSIYEREDKPGYYRMDVYNSDFMYAMFGQPYATAGKKTVIDATDPDKVWFPKQATGVTLNPDDGEIWMASYVDKQFSIDAADSQYGKLVNGVITFPENSIMVSVDDLLKEGNWMSGPAKGLMRIMLPGARLYDYTVSLEASESAGGVTEIDAVFGTDAAKMKYVVCEGTLDDGQVSLKALDLDEGKITADGEVTASGIISITGKATGLYTLVGCVYDAEGKAQEFVSVHFGHVGTGDARPVDFHFGLEMSNELAGQGVNSDNAVKLYAYGEDIVKVEYGFYKTSSMEGRTLEELLEENGKTLTSEQLEDVNDKSFVKWIGGLNGDSDYTLVIRAANDYASKLETLSHHTTGQFNPALEEYTYDDFLDDKPTADRLVRTEWNYYAANLLASSAATRKYIGKVKFENSNQSGIMNVFGFAGVEFDSPEEGYVAMQYNNGLLSTTAAKESVGRSEGQDVYISFIADEDGGAYTGSGFMIGGPVADGYIYFVPNPTYAEQNRLTFNLMAVKKGGEYVGLMHGMMLVDSSKDISKIPAEAVRNMAMFEQIAREWRGPDNCVELKWNERLYALRSEKNPAINYIVDYPWMNN